MCVCSYGALSHVRFNGLQLEDPTDDGPARHVHFADLGRVEKEDNGALGMMDNGATCNAGPESSIRNLLTSILLHDQSAKVEINGQKRPRFRFGSGSWGRALYHLKVTSGITGGSFTAYVLPDPEDAKQLWFQPHMLVPMLIGMDFLQGNGLVVDFSDGYAVCTTHLEAKPFHLHCNSWGHYMIDAAEFLCDHKTCDQGCPEINVIGDFKADLLQPNMNTFTLTFEDDMVDDGVMMTNEMMGAHDDDAHSRHAAFNHVWNRRVALLRNQQHSELMWTSLSLSRNSCTTSDSHGDQEGPEGQDRVRQDQCGRADVRPRDPTGSSRSKDNSKLDMSRPPLGLPDASQQVGSLESLPGLQPSPPLHPQEGCSIESVEEPQPGSGPEDDRRAAQGVESGNASNPRAVRALHPEALGGGAHRRVAGASEPYHSSSILSGTHGQEEGREPSEDTRFCWLYRRKATDYSKILSGQLGASVTQRRGVQPDGLSDGAGEGASDATCCPTHERRPKPGVGPRDVGSTLLRIDYDFPEEPTMKMPLQVGQSVMDTIHKIDMELTNNLSELVYGKQPVIWEMFWVTAPLVVRDCCRF